MLRHYIQIFFYFSLFFFVSGCTSPPTKTTVIKKTVTTQKVVVNEFKSDDPKGVISDVATNLMWQKCSMGQRLLDPQCSGNGIRVIWKSAKDYCEALKLAEFKDWRLPRLEEMKTIVHCSNGKPTPLANQTSCKIDDQPHKTYNKPVIREDLFPNTMVYDYWVNSYYGKNKYNKDASWSLYFRTGYSNFHPVDTKRHVRCVRDLDN